MPTRQRRAYSSARAPGSTTCVFSSGVGTGVVEQVAEETVGRLQKVARESIVLRLAVVHLAKRALVEAEHGGTGKREQQRRVRRDDELCRARRRQAVQDP